MLFQVYIVGNVEYYFLTEIDSAIKTYGAFSIACSISLSMPKLFFRDIGHFRIIDLERPFVPE